MKTPLFFGIGLLGLLVCLGGCSVSNDDGPPPPIVGGSPADSVTISEINAAAALQFENTRMEAMKAIAARPTLSQAAQVHLVRRSYESFNFDNNKVALLEVLVKNTAFCNTAKEAVLNGLGSLTFEPNKAAILALLNKRGDLKE